MEIAGQYLKGEDVNDEQFRQAYGTNPDLMERPERFLLYELENVQSQRNNQKPHSRY